jgi:hypothetical protein
MSDVTDLQTFTSYSFVDAVASSSDQGVDFVFRTKAPSRRASASDHKLLQHWRSGHRTNLSPEKLRRPSPQRNTRSRRASAPSLDELLSYGKFGTALLKLHHPAVAGTLDAISRAEVHVSQECSTLNLPFPRLAWNRMRRLVTEILVDFSLHYGESEPSVPIVSMGDESDIDVQWRTASRNLLISVAGRDDEPVYFHGMDWVRKSHVIKGSLEEGVQNGWILSWLNAR